MRDLSLPAGHIFPGGYEILGELGSGSFGRVYEARQLSTGQKVAIKVLRAAPSEERGERIEERFRREMLLAARLSHPNIIRLVDSGEAEGGLLYAVFQHVPGITLKQVLAKEGKLDVAEAIHLMGQVLDALSSAHVEGVVHRDIKPENIMIMHTGVRRNAMVLDFGLAGFAREDGRGAGLTASRDVMGTPCYAAPEQLRGEPPSVRSDLYSWGVTLLECLTGELAISGASAHEVVYKQLGPEPVPIPSWLRDHRLGPVLSAVTQKRIEKRDVTAAGLLEALSAIAVADPDPSSRGAREADAPSERRQLSIVSCHVNVTDGRGKTVDLEDLDEVLQVQQEAQTQIVMRSGGQPAGFMAERSTFVFGVPQAREDDARRAVRAALQIAAEAALAAERLERERGLRVTVHLGVHTGIVVVRALRRSAQGLALPVGSTPKIAAELAQKARAGEVLASLDTVRLLRDEFASEPAGELSAPQLPAAVATLRVGLRAQDLGGAESLAGPLETTLVGRSRPLAELRQAWERAEGGQPSAVLLRGDAGIGKSRLLRELRRTIPRQAWLQSRCLAENQGSPLRPFVDLLSALEEPIDSLLLRLGFDLAETLPVFAALLGRPDDRYPSPPQSPEKQKDLALEALLALFVRLAEAGPFVFALEDLHWADPTSLELLALLAQSLRPDAGPTRRLLAVFTARAEFEPPWPKQAVPLVALDRLSDREVAEMITAGLRPGRALDPKLVDEVVRRADGIPLFVEEVTSALAGDQSAGSGDAPSFTIPSTLRDLLAARLDRLSQGAREIAQLAAVLGREFPYELLRAVFSGDEGALRDATSELQSAGLVLRRRSVRRETYAFKHALLRDAAYESLTRPTRMRIHQRVASTLRHRFPEFERSRPEILAHHFEGGGQIETAVDYLHLAGSNALRRAAYRESLVLLEHGLALSRGLEETPGRRRQQAELLSTTGSVQISLHGYAAPEVESTFRQAGECCEKIEGDIPIHVLFGGWAVAITRSDRSGVEALLPRFRRIVEHSGDIVARLTAFSALGCGAYWRGAFAEAEESFVQGRLLFENEEFQRFAQVYGYSAGLYSYAIGMLNLWCLGYPAKARAVREEFLRISEVARDPYLRVTALALGLTLAHDCDEPELELDLAERLFTLATEQRLPMWWGAAYLGRGGALLRRGHVEEALPLIQDGLERFGSVGVMCSYNYFLQHLARAHLGVGRVEEGLAAIEESRALCRTLWARCHEPELLRLRGELQMLRGAAAEAEASFRESMTMAREQSGKSYELRSACSLSRLLRTQGRAAEARDQLQGVFGWFSEGFDTPDLRQASALLAEL